MQARPHRRHSIAALLALGAVALLAGADGSPRAEVPAMPGDEASLASFRVVPERSTLAGPRATRQLLAEAGGGSPRDLTRAVAWASLDPTVATVASTGRVTPRGDGTATIVARWGSGAEARAVVEVSGMVAPGRVSFRNDVVAAFSQANCNMGACHGTPTGKGGFRLSLRGYLPDQDFMTVTREVSGRRVDLLAADTSLLLTKPLGTVPHEGGLRLTRGTPSFDLIRAWIAEGAKDDPAAPKPVALEIAPGPRLLEAPARTQQVAVVARYADGASRDITPLCYYSSSNPTVAEVDADGFVSFKNPGEVAVIAHYLGLVATVRLTHLIAVPGFAASEVPEGGPIDRAVFGKLNRMRVEASPDCTDAEFVRRASLDLIGTLPAPAEVEAFTTDPAPDRRVKLVDALLARPEFADFWALKLADILRANGRLLESKGTLAFHRWIRANLEQDVPLDRFVRDLLTADGSSLRNPAASYYRISKDPESAVESTAQLFLGVRIQCAKCHNHPFERWTQDDYYGFAAFFARVKRKPGGLPGDEVVFLADKGEVKQPRTGKPMPPKALGGPTYDDPKKNPADRREALAAWLTGADNPFFARSLANRIWYHLMGRGVVEPVDDFRDSNPASNDELLAALAANLTDNGFQLRPLVRAIATSRAYGLSAQPKGANGADVMYFSHAYARLLPAEVLLDAISTVTDTATPFENLPKGTRAVQIPDGKTEHTFLKTFGRPARELACECERETDSNLSQALQLIGGATLNGKLRDDSGRMARLAASPLDPAAIAGELYLVALGRPATPFEVAAATRHFAATPDRRQATEDLAWAIINSKEFLFRH